MKTTKFLNKSKKIIESEHNILFTRIANEISTSLDFFYYDHDKFKCNVVLMLRNNNM